MLVVVVFVGCDRSSPASDPHRATPGGASPSVSAIPDPVASAFARFTGFPALHGEVVLSTADGDVFSFEIWAREPEFRIDARMGDTTVPWIVNEEGSNIREPHLHAPLLIQTDPRNIVLSCDNHRVIGAGTVIGRSVTEIRCRSGSEALAYWIDDATGLVLAGKGEDSRWEFTALDLDPDFPPGLFEFEGEPLA